MLRTICLAGLAWTFFLLMSTQAVGQETPDDTDTENSSSQAAKIAKPESVNNALPNLLIIGDETSLGFTKPVRELLKNKYNVYRIPEISKDTTYGLKNLQKWLKFGPGKWETIVYNFGNWDILEARPNEYEENLEKITKELKKTEATILFSRTIPNERLARNHSSRIGEYAYRLRVYNALVSKVLKEEHVGCIDLINVILPRVKMSEGPLRFDLSPLGYQALAKKVAEVVLEPSKANPSHEMPKITYYMIVFAAQSGPSNQIRRSHTFATFVKANENNQILETVTISWLDAEGEIEVLDPIPQRGQNLSLKASLDWAVKNRARVSQWGPFQIQPVLFYRAQAREKFLTESKKAKYLILDKSWRKRTGSGTVAFDCIHAVSDIGGNLRTYDARGDDASAMVVRHLQPWVIRRVSEDAWLIRGLKINKYQIRELHNRTGR